MPSPARSRAAIVQGWSPRTRPSKRRPSVSDRWNALPWIAAYVHQARVARDRLPARLADVGLVVPARDPSPVAVELDPLADDGADGRVLGRAHEGGQPVRQDHVVRVEERQPRPARDLEPAVPRVRDPAVGRQPDQDDARVALGDRGHDVGGAVGGGVVDDEAPRAGRRPRRGSRPAPARRSPRRSRSAGGPTAGAPPGSVKRVPGRQRSESSRRLLHVVVVRGLADAAVDTGRAPRPAAPGPHP